MLNDLSLMLSYTTYIHFGCVIWRHTGDQWKYHNFIGTLNECIARIDDTFSELNKKLNNDKLE
jgi:hypothetical protein